MFRLRVLGGFALQERSEASTFPVPQRQAEAVLAVLAVCGDLGCSRERLMALLWPESDEARSRSALRSTLHTIRLALGPGAVLSAGELLRLDPSVVGSDVQSFAEALGSDRLADAARSYGGPLLEGFHLDGAPDFERWLDAERTRLARECLEALERLAQRAEARGAWAEAAGWWARTVEQDPLNSRLVLQHARSLEALGDRANAIKAAEVHVRRLRDELDVEPDREVLATIAGMRRGEVSRPPSERPRSAEESPAHPGRLATPSAVTSIAETPPLRAARSRRRPVVVGALGGVAVLAVAAGLAGLLVRRAPSAIPLDRTAIAVLPFQVVGADSASPARTLARFMGDLFELKVTGEFGLRIRHPGSVAERWRAAGGTLDSALSEESELSVARSVGAGRLVRGTVVALGHSLMVSASMVDAATGAVRVTPQQVRGTIASQEELVDRLIILLLARDAGFSPASAPRLVQYEPEAVQAYLAANGAPTFAEKKVFYRAALAADSHLVDAALMVWAWGEGGFGYDRDTVELRYAWEHQDRLTERGRAYLQVLAAGRHGSIRTKAQVIAGYEALTRQWPEWSTPWSELGEKLTFWGALASVPDWRRRAREALERADPPGSGSPWLLTELAFLDGDTARAREAIDTQAARRSRPEMVPAYRWRLAVLMGDAAAATRALSQPQEPWWVIKFAQADGRGIADADRVYARWPDNWWYHWWPWARGREVLWREGWRRAGPPTGELGRAVGPVYSALLLGPSEDAKVVEEVRSLERIADGTQSPGASADVRTEARCWLALWRLRHGDAAAAQATARYLDGDTGRRRRFVGWARLLDVLITEAAGGNTRAALLRMDSVVRELPLPTRYGEVGFFPPLPYMVQNLLLARMLHRYGEPERALAAARRHGYGDFAGEYLELPEYLREEGRLAALTGDTAGAIRAYRHYLALREDPDPPWRAARDSVRTELAALVRR